MALIDDIVSVQPGRLFVDVPEFTAPGEPPMRLFFTPYTLADDRKLNKWIKEDSPEAWAEVCIRKLTTEDGELAFERKDKQDLMHKIPAAVLKRVGLVIIASIPSQEEAEKN